ncbi:hypothetical protein [Actinokineospora sp. NBRC 105648]|uniref:hypothetical protein n=1 Tax=Actinokineospora sp. NBRC 105648 TaxID=3032206 RepID=UPI002555EEA7|nr:hypothetical protein [Actinokineospora sp. NBRC 105648]
MSGRAVPDQSCPLPYGLLADAEADRGAARVEAELRVALMAAIAGLEGVLAQAIDTDDARGEAFVCDTLSSLHTRVSDIALRRARRESIGRFPQT